MPGVQYVDPAVSRAKFDREVGEFRRLGHFYRQRGWFLVNAEFPQALVVLATPKIKPSIVLMAVEFDYTNYDAAPPSVRLVSPFTGEPYKSSELPSQLPRSLPEQQIQLPGMAAGTPQMVVQQQQALMQAYGPDDIPFMCLAGVLEYHEHPAHSGDAWELHRAQGAGRLVRLLDIISKYSVDTVVGFGVQLTPVVSIKMGPAPL